MKHFILKEHHLEFRFTLCSGLTRLLEHPSWSGNWFCSVLPYCGLWTLIQLFWGTSVFGCRWIAHMGLSTHKMLHCAAYFMIVVKLSALFNMIMCNLETWLMVLVTLSTLNLHFPWQQFRHIYQCIRGCNWNFERSWAKNCKGYNVPKEPRGGIMVWKILCHLRP